MRITMENLTLANKYFKRFFECFALYGEWIGHTSSNFIFGLVTFCPCTFISERLVQKQGVSVSE
jgi:hypothetical protein